VTSQELEYLIELGARQGSLDKVKERLLSSVLAFTEVLVKEIMLPRTQVVALEEAASYEDVMKLATESELSRIPVYRGTMDEVVGILYVKLMLADLRKGLDPDHFQLAKYVKRPFFVPEVMKVSRLLAEMQRRKTHIAIVVDEFGGTSGIVTLEDVVEEIVGEIHDESDVEEKKLRVQSDGVILADLVEQWGVPSLIGSGHRTGAGLGIDDKQVHGVGPDVQNAQPHERTLRVDTLRHLSSLHGAAQ